jgi:hypothetical protein
LMGDNIPVIHYSDGNTRTFWSISCTVLIQREGKIPLVRYYLFLSPLTFS